MTLYPFHYVATPSDHGTNYQSVNLLIIFKLYRVLIPTMKHHYVKQLNVRINSRYSFK